MALTIAGSDSGGGAGIQADIKTFFALDIFGTSAITCVTAQNPDAIRGISAVPSGMVMLQIRTVCEGFPVSAVKTGMLYSAAIIRAVAESLVLCNVPLLVIDPVMTASSGSRVLREDAVELLCTRLLPMATVITPNIPEAEILCGHTITSVDASKAAAREISERYGTACVVKGGHLSGSKVVDVLFEDGAEHCYSSIRLKVAETHGTGCVFSAALTAFLARGESLHNAVRKAKLYVRNSLKATTHVATKARRRRDTKGIKSL